jgi:DNA polymerase-3 subunit alpha
MSQHFSHLHLHTDYSLLDGAITIEKLVNHAKQQQFKSLAITDHGNIFGAVKFFQQCKKAGIKPILGMEAYFTDDVSIKAVDKKYYHLILLVQNNVGYKNLCKLISFAYQDGFYFKPRIDYNVLAKYSEGLIATTACLGGHIPQLLMAGDDQEAEKRMDWFLNTFGPDRFYLEVQPEDQKDQIILNQKLWELSAKKNVKCIATADCHYLTPQDHEAHEVMLCIQTQGKLSDTDRYTFGDSRVHVRSTEEMLKSFDGHQDAVWNTGAVADMCSFDFETGKLFFPTFEVPVQHTTDTFFKELCQIGLERLVTETIIVPEQKELYQKRLDLEVDLIIKMGFVGYFLVVSDFIQWAYREGIPVGPGRGSAAGSLVAWTLQITNIDPLKYNLLFERFLNPERVSMPDIDIDFCIEGRERVINYIRDKYGHDHVCQIITFGTMMAKGVIKDVARALGFSFEDSNAITTLIPDQLKITLGESYEQEPRFKELVETNPRARKLYDLALRLEGVTRHASKHAAGIVISPEPINEVLPIYIPSKSNDLVTQYAMTELESLGFLKIDLLGLKNLTLIDKVIRLIAKNHGIAINVNKLPLDDPKTFVLLSEGKTSGVFQLESDGLKDVLRKLQPDKFEDIIAVNALYRPGPLGSGMVDDYIERRHGRQKIVYLFPELEPILQETYGVIVYQEQVIKIASTIGGYSLGQADILRRAMGKKKAEVMAEQKAIFVQNAIKLNFNEKKAGDLFDLMAYFAGYGFNKSHSAAYALIAYQTAYLKAHYPAEFMAHLISLEVHDTEKMSAYLQEAKEMGLAILPPDINHSEVDFTVVDNKILFGLHGIKNIGLAAIENIIQERAKKPYSDLLNFCTRVDLRTSNKRVLEHLIFGGAFDGLPGNRAQKFVELSTIIDQALEKKKSALTGQMGLFSMAATPNSSATDEMHLFQPLAEWSDKEKLEKEKEVIGFYVSSHPLDNCGALKWLALTTIEGALAKIPAASAAHDVTVVCCGLLKTKKVIMTKKNDKMAFIQIEDNSGSAEVVLFPRTYQKVEQWLDSHQIFLVKGQLDLTSQQKCKIKANECIPVELFFEEWPAIERATMQLPAQFEEQLIEAISQQLASGKIPLDILFNEQGKKLKLSVKRQISLTQDVITALEKQQISIKLQI